MTISRYDITRAKTVTHVEYEVLQVIKDTINLYELKTKMGPKEDEVADKRFRKGVANINQYLTNMMDRRKHRLPEGHLDYEPKESEKES